MSDARMPSSTSLKQVYASVMDSSGNVVNLTPSLESVPITPIQIVVDMFVYNQILLKQLENRILTLEDILCSTSTTVEEPNVKQE